MPSEEDAYLSALDILKATLNSISNDGLTKQELQIIVSSEESMKNFTEIVKIFKTEAGNDVLKQFQKLQQLNWEFDINFTYILKMLQYCQPLLNQKGKGSHIVIDHHFNHSLYCVLLYNSDTQ